MPLGGTAHKCQRIHRIRINRKGFMSVLMRHFCLQCSALAVLLLLAMIISVSRCRRNPKLFLSRTGHWSVRDNNFRVFADRGESKKATKTSAGAADAQRKEHKTQTKGTTAHGQHMPQRFLRAQRLASAVIIFGGFVTSISRSRDKKNQIRPTATLGKLRIRGQRLTIYNIKY